MNENKFGDISPSQKATFKQLQGVTGHLASLSPNKKLYHFGNIRGALVALFEGKLTHGDVQKLFAVSSFPKSIKDSIDTFQSTKEELPLS